MVVERGETDSQQAFRAANCTLSTHCLGGFTGLWTNRIGAVAAVLGRAKTGPEELPPAPSYSPINPVVMS